MLQSFPCASTASLPLNTLINEKFLSHFCSDCTYTDEQRVSNHVYQSSSTVGAKNVFSDLIHGEEISNFL